MDAVQNRLSVSSASEVNKRAKPELGSAQSLPASAISSSAVGSSQDTTTFRPVTQTERSRFEPIRAELEESVAAANDRLAVYNQKLDIAIDGATGAIVVKVSDADTGETLRQIPSEDALRIMRNIDSLTGILVDHKE